jgi:alkyl sulfatase BDS1-like metallo-beta-lactamase superfamily hydrolase
MKMPQLRVILELSAVALTVAAVTAQPLLAQSKAAEPATRAANEAFVRALPFSDRADFDDARRGFVATLPDGVIAGPGGRPAFDTKPYAFLQKDEAPATVNPSLWRQAQLNALNGLFEVTGRVYQVRGLDIANMTIIEGDTGLILIDPLLCNETAKAALDLYLANRPAKPIAAVIYSHSHVDHFGGAKGVMSPEDAASGRVKVIAPDGFMEHAVAENVIAGNAMSRRAQYQFGSALPVGERAQIDTGLGKALSKGTVSLIPPNDVIKQAYETRTVDGVEIEIAEQLKLPGSLAGDWASRGYYGTLSHNAKAVYQFYLGWYDANPADLNPLPRAEMARKQVDYMGGAEAVLKRARDDFAAGQYRWVASVTSQLVFADPANKAARDLGADALEQLGYQSEAATWRNAYLLGAQELRGGVPAAQGGATANAELLKGVSIDLAFDFLGVRLNAAKAEGKTIVINWTFTDLNQSYVMNLENSALTHRAGKLADNADAGVKLTRAALDAITLKQRTFLGSIATGDVSISGNPLKLRELFGLLDDFSPDFEIVEPKKASVE